MSALSTGEDHRVTKVVSRYQRVKVLPTLATALCEAPEFEAMFWDTLSNENFLYCQRSQTLADGQLNIAQRAFVVLYNDLDSPVAAASLWVDEILGLNLIEQASNGAVLTAAVQTRALALDQIEKQHGIERPKKDMLGSITKKADPARTKAVPTSSSSVTYQSSHSGDGSQSQSPENLRKGIQKSYAVDRLGDDRHIDKLSKLLTCYDKAKHEFEAAPPKSLDRTRCAKFLRDTIENYLTYVRRQRPPPAPRAQVIAGVNPTDANEARTLVEMEGMLEETIAIAEKGSGGKKRAFDEGGEARPSKVGKKAQPKFEESITLYPKKRTGTEGFNEHRGSTYNGYGHPHPPEYRGQRMPLSERIRAPIDDTNGQHFPTGERRLSASPERKFVNHTEQGDFRGRGRGRGRGYRGRGMFSGEHGVQAPPESGHQRDRYRPAYQ